MFKKLFLVTLCSLNLCIAAPLNSLALSAPNPTRYATTGDLILAILGLVIIPHMLKSYSEMDDKEKDFKDRVSESLLIGAGLSFFMYETAKLCVFAKNFYAYCNPSEAQKAITEAARERNKQYQAKNAFRDCLMKNAKTPRNASGIPTACEELAIAFEAIAGKTAHDEMVTNFKTAYQE